MTSSLQVIQNNYLPDPPLFREADVCQTRRHSNSPQFSYCCQTTSEKSQAYTSVTIPSIFTKFPLALTAYTVSFIAHGEALVPAQLYYQYQVQKPN